MASHFRIRHNQRSNRRVGLLPRNPTIVDILRPSRHYVRVGILRLGVGSRHGGYGETKARQAGEEIYHIFKEVRDEGNRIVAMGV